MKITQATLQQLAQNYWDEYCEIFPRLVKFDCPKIELNGRYTKTAACNPFEENKVIMGTKFFAKHADNMIRVILPHELAHQIDYNLNGWYNRKQHHGKQWVEIMVKIGQEPNPYHSMAL